MTNHTWHLTTMPRPEAKPSRAGGPEGRVDLTKIIFVKVFRRRPLSKLGRRHRENERRCKGFRANAAEITPLPA